MSKDLDLLFALLKGHAAAIGLEFAEHPQITGDMFSGTDAQSSRLSPDQLPGACRGCRVGHHFVILGPLPMIADPDSVLANVRRYRNQCVIARSNLTADEALDLNLFLMGPPGSDVDEDWKALGATIERDDRVARKQVWLRPVHEQAYAESFRLFCERTFMARPWLLGATIDAELDALDPIEELFQDDRAPDGVGDAWLSLADGGLEPGPELVDALVQQYRGGV